MLLAKFLRLLLLVIAAAFLAAVKDLAGDTPQGLSTVDKAVEAVNTVKVVAGLNKMAKLLKASFILRLCDSRSVVLLLLAYICSCQVDADVGRCRYACWAHCGAELDRSCVLHLTVCACFGGCRSSSRARSRTRAQGTC